MYMYSICWYCLYIVYQGCLSKCAALPLVCASYQQVGVQHVLTDRLTDRQVNRITPLCDYVCRVIISSPLRHLLKNLHMYVLFFLSAGDVRVDQLAPPHSPLLYLPQSMSPMTWLQLHSVHLKHLHNWEPDLSSQELWKSTKAQLLQHFLLELRVFHKW